MGVSIVIANKGLACKIAQIRHCERRSRVAIYSVELRRRVGIADGFYKWIATPFALLTARNDGVGWILRNSRVLPWNRHCETLRSRVVAINNDRTKATHWNP